MIWFFLALMIAVVIVLCVFRKNGTDDTAAQIRENSVRIDNSFNNRKIGDSIASYSVSSLLSMIEKAKKDAAVHDGTFTLDPEVEQRLRAKIAQEEEAARRDEKLANAICLAYEDASYFGQTEEMAALDPGLQNLAKLHLETLRALAKELSREPDIGVFLNDLPHKYFDENQLHAFIISEIKDFDICIKEVDRFLPFVDNWATCDQLSPKVFKKHKKGLLVYIKRWIKSDKVYTVRFGVGMLLSHFLDDDFDKSYLDMAADICSDEYYINMMTAWYFATALTKQYESALPYIENKKLDVWTHNKAIQKACESYRVSDEHKNYLRQLKIKK